jgi:dGTPase
MLTRKDFEKIEKKILAPYAVYSSQTKGRLYLEPDPQSRTHFQRDRDRVVHSKSFRRLMHKTQVFVALESDHYRNRLTHSLEVAQIARHIARLLSLNEDLTEVIAFAHDLGHTPFGHSGEEALNALMKDHGGFEHNSQSKRIVEELETKYQDFNGLNLTYEVRDGLMKHRTPHDNPTAGESVTLYPSLEARIVNIADEIAYNSHDLDDGLASEIIDPGDLAKITLWQEATEHNNKTYTNLDQEKLNSLNVRYLIGQQIIDLAKQASENIAGYSFKTVEDVYKCADKIVCFSKEMYEKNDQLRPFLMENFYRHPEIKQNNTKATEIITFLFNHYEKNPGEVPFVDRFPDTPVKLAITDYIAGMTDNFAQAEVDRLHK